MPLHRRSRARWLMPVLLAVLVVASLPAPGLADPVAVIAAIKGRVEVTPATRGPAQRATVGRPLERGDRVVVPAGGSASLFFNDGNMLVLDGKNSLRIEGRIGGAAGRASGLPNEVYTSVSKFVTGGSRETGVFMQPTLRSAGGGAPFLMSPRRTAIMTDRPTFAWRAVPGATRYRVTVSSAEHGELWTREVEGTSLAFPSDAAALVRTAEYLWEVEALSDAKALRREESVFEVTSEGHAQKVLANLALIHESAGGAASPAAQYLAGCYLSGLELYLDAVEQFTAMAALLPDSPAPHAGLGAVYAKVGLADLSAAEYQQALALSREP